jgi:hypothetical protein
MIAVEYLPNGVEDHNGIDSLNYYQIGSNSILNIPDKRQFQISLTTTNVSPSWELQFHSASILDANPEQTRTSAHTKLIQYILE